jgi:arylsulfatase A-like enzyme
LDNTIVFITGDHGAVFNTLDQEDIKTSSYMLDNVQFRVPLYIYLPFNPPYALENDIIGSHVDILPTILDVLGIKCEKQVQGRSLFDPKIKNRISFIYTDYYKHIVAGLNGNFYMVRDMTEDLTVLSKSLSFHPDICKDSEELCSRIRAKVDEFDRYQDRRLYNYF